MNDFLHVFGCMLIGIDNLLPIVLNLQTNQQFAEIINLFVISACTLCVTSIVLLFSLLIHSILTLVWPPYVRPTLDLLPVTSEVRGRENEIDTRAINLNHLNSCSY